MWQTKTFKTKQAMQKFIDNHKIQWHEIFICCPPGKSRTYGIEYRYLRIINV